MLLLSLCYHRHYYYYCYHCCYHYAIINVKGFKLGFLIRGFKLETAPLVSAMYICLWGGGCPNYGSLLGVSLHSRGHSIMGTQNGTRIVGTEERAREREREPFWLKVLMAQRRRASANVSMVVHSPKLTWKPI